MSQLVVFRRESRPDPDFDAFLLAMWLMFARAPRQATPDVDGSYSLGEIGTVPEKQWTRLTPYSLAKHEPESHECRCGMLDCLGHEVIDEQIQFPGFTSELVMRKSPHDVWVSDVPATEAFYESGERQR